jgi:hypothetical protein
LNEVGDTILKIEEEKKDHPLQNTNGEGEPVSAPQSEKLERLKEKDPERSIGYLVDTSSENKDAVQAFLTENNFPGNNENAASLIMAVHEGATFVHNGFSERKIPIEQPMIGLITEPNILPANVCVDQNTRTIYLKAAFVEHFSHMHPDTKIQHNTNLGEPYFRGRLSDMFRLFGVEEAHHDVYNQLKGPHEGIENDSLPLAPYDADEREYQALRWQVRYAKQTGMPEQTRTLLEERLRNAQEVRKQK